MMCYFRFVLAFLAIYGSEIVESVPSRALTADPLSLTPSPTERPTALGECETGVTVFTFTGTVQDYIVPLCTAYLEVIVAGARGGSDAQTIDIVPGLGALVKEKKLLVTPGSTLKVHVGGAGDDVLLNSAGGFNGGGAASPILGTGGGGSSDSK